MIILPGDPFGQLLDYIAGKSAAAITRMNDPGADLAAASIALVETAKDVPLLLAAVRKVLEVADEFDGEGQARSRAAWPGGRVARGQGTPGGPGRLIGEDGVAKVSTSASEEVLNTTAETGAPKPIGSPPLLCGSP